jgi:hypothetical protein
MAIKIEVVKGQDAGWVHVVYSREAKIGRGSGNHIRLTDPAWQEGHLELVNRGGGWLVVNRMPHGVFHQGQILEPGKSRTWYEGELLQPTAGTLLVLRSDDSKPSGGQAIVSMPPAEKAKKSPLIPLVAAGSLALAFLMFHYRGSEGSSPKTAESFEPPAVSSLADHHEVGKYIKRIRALVSQAEFSLRTSNTAEALSTLRQARDQAKRLEDESVQLLGGNGSEEFRTGIAAMRFKICDRIAGISKATPAAGAT